MGRTPAVVLLSGGLDSATVAAIARSAGHAIHALSFDYGQRHRHELTSAALVAAARAASFCGTARCNAAQIVRRGLQRRTPQCGGGC